MSNRRRTGVRSSYTSGYLKSPAWFARRDRWFREEARWGRPLTCAACLEPEVSSQLELHHLDYSGIHQLPDGRYQAAERHADLVPMHPRCHETLHRLIERDEGMARHRTRRTASLMALDRLRTKMSALKDPS